MTKHTIVVSLAEIKTFLARPAWELKLHLYLRLRDQRGEQDQTLEELRRVAGHYAGSRPVFPSRTAVSRFLQRRERNGESQVNATAADVPSPPTAVTSAKPGESERKANAKPKAKITWSPEDGWQGITAADRQVWAEAYPAVDAQRQLAAMTAWLHANPKKAHKSNWRRFVTNWLSKNQDRGGDVGSKRPDDADAQEQLERIRHAEDGR